MEAQCYESIIVFAVKADTEDEARRKLAHILLPIVRKAAYLNRVSLLLPRPDAFFFSIQTLEPSQEKWLPVKIFVDFITEQPTLDEVATLWEKATDALSVSKRMSEMASAWLLSALEQVSHPDLHLSSFESNMSYSKAQPHSRS